MLLTNTVTVKINGKNIKHYKQLGYDIKFGDEFTVPIEHLSHGSHAIVDVECDFCKKKIQKEYKCYLQQRKYGLDTCAQCKNIKSKKTCVERYGVESVMHVDKFKQKLKQTFIEKYGVENISQNPQIQEKIKQSFIEKYGVDHPAKLQETKDKKKETCLQKYGFENAMQNKDVYQKAVEINLKKYGCKTPTQNETVQNKISETCLKKYGAKCALLNKTIIDKIKQTNVLKYGYENVFSSPEIKRKIVNTNIEKYGYPYSILNKEIKQKAILSYYKNQTQRTSKQQTELYNMIKSIYPNAHINYPEGVFSLDVFLEVDGTKIDIEYDGWYWHQDKHKDVVRDMVLKQNGYKVLKIRSGTLLPEESDLTNAILYLVNTQHTFTEIVLDDWKEVEMVE